MAAITGISWCDSTANLWRGCQAVSPACDNCYAETFVTGRMGGCWGPQADRVYIKQGWADLRKWQRQAERNGGVDPALGRRRRVFINSLSDFFDNHRSITWRDEAWRLFRDCTHLDIILLTKRPQNIRKMLPPFWADIAGHIYVMVTTENQEEAERRIPAMFAAFDGIEMPHVFGISAEPLLGPLELERMATFQFSGAEYLNALTGQTYGLCGERGPRLRYRMSWVICGGESGGKARVTQRGHVIDLEKQCGNAGVAFHLKQWGEWIAIKYVPEAVARRRAPLQKINGTTYARLGRNATGNKLRGQSYLEFPPQPTERKLI